MRQIRSKDTKAELTVRHLLHRAGYRYRIHGKDLPGKPDLVFKARRKVIFVHGCFWHQHDANNCTAGKRPQSNTDYWHPKLARNVERDRLQLERLEQEGWGVLVVWECELRDADVLRYRLISFLGPARLAGSM
jgi:DNA mismatch endonuclease (patch repair protein)